MPKIIQIQVVTEPILGPSGIVTGHHHIVYALDDGGQMWRNDSRTRQAAAADGWHEIPAPAHLKK